MLLSSVILVLQETLEAALLVSVLLTISSQQWHRVTWLWFGVFGGIVLSFFYARFMADISEWFDYVDFHLTIMGCHFCRASFKDLRQQQQTSRLQEDLRQRIMASTIGFLSKF